MHPLFVGGLTFCRVEDSVGLSIAHVATLRFAIMLEGAGLTKIVLAPERRLVGQQTATETLERNI